MAAPARIVVAVDGFKGSISAADAAAALAEAWGSGAVPRPMADGGEGTVAAFEAAVPGSHRMPVTVPGPHGRPVAAHWLLLPDGTGVVELASTCGIELLSGDLRPWDADTGGFGEAIAAALDAGVARLVLGIGSSASTDCGAGLLRALGARIVDAAGRPVVPGLRGLRTVDRVDLGGVRPLPPGGVRVLSDVASPLLGGGGAAAVFGPQKGLDADGVAAADEALARYAALFDVDPATPGAGAAGGTGFALLAWGARLVAGAPAVAELIGLDEALAGARLVVTGEGSYDASSAAGKVPALVAERAARAGVPVALVAGRIADDADVSGFAASVSLADLAGGADAAIADPARWLRAAGDELAQRFSAPR